MALKITFEKKSKNSENALTGDLTLFDGSKAIMTVTVFSGGNTFNPLDDGKYRLRLDIRGGNDTNEVNPDGTLKPFYGIQRVGDNIQDGEGQAWNGQTEWGTIRARLNPTNGTDHGDYIHGKKRPRDYTHGCICDRSEQVLEYLWNLKSPPVGIDVIVSGGDKFDLEQIVSKNVAKKKQAQPGKQTRQYNTKSVATAKTRTRDGGAR